MICVDLHPASLAILRKFAEYHNKPIRVIASDVLESIFQAKRSFVVIEPPPTRDQLKLINDFIADTMGYARECIQPQEQLLAPDNVTQIQ